MEYKNINKINFQTIAFIFLIIILIFTVELTIAVPNGANVEFINSSSFNGGSGTENISAFAGNVTEININGASNTQVWQGYFGNVSGGLFLADSSSRVFYNWTAIGTTGEVYSSVNDSVAWTNIMCFNFTAKGNFSDDSSQKGNTSLYGLNSSQLNSNYGITIGDSDTIENTFSSKDHRNFYTNGLEFIPNECQSVKILNSSGSGVFEEILLYSPENRQVVFTSIIQHNTLGFDSMNHDFEMLVLDDGHGTNTLPTPYYFYLELGS